MAEYPNDASRKSKAEGDRLSSNGEEITNQESRPSPGKAKCGPPGGLGSVEDAAVDKDIDKDERRSER